MLLFLFIFGWLISGVLAYGISFADFEAISQYDHTLENMYASVVVGLFGYIGIIVSFILSGFAEHGLKFY